MRYGVQDIAADDAKGPFFTKLLLQAQVQCSPRGGVVNTKQAAGLIKPGDLKGEILWQVEILGELDLEIVPAQLDGRLVVYGAGFLPRHPGVERHRPPGADGDGENGGGGIGLRDGKVDGGECLDTADGIDRGEVTGKRVFLIAVGEPEDILAEAIVKFQVVGEGGLQGGIARPEGIGIYKKHPGGDIRKAGARDPAGIQKIDGIVAIYFI